LSSIVLKVFIATGFLLGCKKLSYPINKYWGDLRQGGERQSRGKYTKEVNESKDINTTALLGAQ
jgi:hypothetical protein